MGNSVKMAGGDIYNPNITAISCPMSIRKTYFDHDEMASYFNIGTLVKMQIRHSRSGARIETHIYQVIKGTLSNKLYWKQAGLQSQKSEFKPHLA